MENLLGFDFSVMVRGVGGVGWLTGEGREGVGEGEGVGTGREGELEERPAGGGKSVSSTIFWMLARRGYCCLVLARRCGSGSWGGGMAPRPPMGPIGNSLGGIIPSPGGKDGGAPALMAFCRMSRWVKGSRNG